MKKEFWLVISLAGATQRVQVIGEVANIARALNTVRMFNPNFSAELHILDQNTKCIGIIRKENIFDTYKPHIPATPVEIQGARFESKISMDITRKMAQWLVTGDSDQNMLAA